MSIRYQDLLPAVGQANAVATEIPEDVCLCCLLTEKVPAARMHRFEYDEIDETRVRVFRRERDKTPFIEGHLQDVVRYLTGYADAVRLMKH